RARSGTRGSRRGRTRRRPRVPHDGRPPTARTSSGPLASGGDVLGPVRFLQHRLRSREPCEGHAVGRAADVVEPEPVAELHRLRVAAVLAADAELDALLRPTPSLDRDSHQLADAGLVEGLERVVLDDAVLEVEREELALGVVAR